MKIGSKLDVVTSVKIGLTEMGNSEPITLKIDNKNAFYNTALKFLFSLSRKLFSQRVRQRQ